MDIFDIAMANAMNKGGSGGGGGLPVVELSTVIANTGDTFSEADGALLDSASTAGMPFIAKFTHSMGDATVQYTTLVNIAEIQGIKVLMTFIIVGTAQISTVFMPTDGGWSVNFASAGAS